MATIDPPYRIDPLQTIIRIRSKDDKEKKPGGGSDKKGTSNPGRRCSCYISGFFINTCWCPGILCMTDAFGARASLPCTYLYTDNRPDHSGACASKLWSWYFYWMCCSQGNQKCRTITLNEGASPPGAHESPSAGSTGQ